MATQFSKSASNYAVANFNEALPNMNPTKTVLMVQVYYKSCGKLTTTQTDINYFETELTGFKLDTVYKESASYKEYIIAIVEPQININLEIAELICA